MVCARYNRPNGCVVPHNRFQVSLNILPSTFGESIVDREFVLQTSQCTDCVASYQPGIFLRPSQRQHPSSSEDCRWVFNTHLYSDEVGYLPPKNERKDGCNQDKRLWPGLHPRSIKSKGSKLKNLRAVSRPKYGIYRCRGAPQLLWARSRFCRHRPAGSRRREARRCHEERWGSWYQSLNVTLLGTGKCGARDTQCTVYWLIVSLAKEQCSVDLLDKLILCNTFWNLKKGSKLFKSCRSGFPHRHYLPPSSPLPSPFQVCRLTVTVRSQK